MAEKVEPGSTMYSPASPNLTGIEKIQKARLEEKEDADKDLAEPGEIRSSDIRDVSEPIKRSE